MSAVSSRAGRSVALLAPLLLFLIGFFVWPLLSMMSQAVSDQAVLRLLPRRRADGLGPKVAANGAHADGADGRLEGRR